VPGETLDSHVPPGPLPSRPTPLPYYLHQSNSEVELAVLAQKTIELICEACGTEFTRRATEHKRNVQKGRSVFCSGSCAGKKVIHNLDGKPRTTAGLIPGRPVDEHSPYRYYANKSRARNKKRSADKTGISIDYLKRIWDEQDGTCPLSGVKMFLPPNTGWWDNKNRVMDQWVASLDRIDSSRPYEEGNVQFVCFMANMCKNKFSDEDVVEFCRLVTEHNYTHE